MTEDLVIYMATHNKKCSHIVEHDYIVPIQVGKALNKEVIEEVGDDTGDNISEKNPVYCELTALYWMWKNTQPSNIGLYHYRRRFNIDKNKIIEVLNDNDIIMPKKKLFRMSVEKQYIKEHGTEEWNILLDVLRQFSPEYYETSKSIFSNNVIYRFNMFICNKELFDNYCEWLFPILSKIAEMTKYKERDNYQKRYIGFMAERLFTLYVLHNKLKIFEIDILFEEKRVRYEKIKNIVNNIIFKYRN